MFEEIPLPLDWPVYVSHAEASAYAAWAGKRLPTEAEWHRAAYAAPDGAEEIFRGAMNAEPRHGYFDFERWDPSPVNAFPAGRSAFGVEGLLANGWEWTSSLFEPFAGFQPVSVLRRLFRELLRRHALRHEGRLATHRAEHACGAPFAIGSSRITNMFTPDSAVLESDLRKDSHADKCNCCGHTRWISPPTFGPV